MNNEFSSVALGFFDGLHPGHRSVLRNALSHRADGLTPGVMLFDKPPFEELTGKKVARLLTDEARDKILTDSGFSLFNISFSEIRDMSPKAFVRDILADRFSARSVSCGFNFTFGKNGEGNTDTLISECEKCGISVHIADRVLYNNDVVCSSAIRRYISDGEIEKANNMLGYTFGFTAPVFHGDRRGRLLGSPTINQYIPQGLVVPKFGVYASFVDIDGKLLSGVTNIGKRPTFDGESLRSETFILGFNGDLYDKSITVYPIEFIRGEMKFSSAEALKEQISKDERTAAEITENKQVKLPDLIQGELL